MAVHTTDHQPLTIQLHYLILRIQHKITEAYFVWHHFHYLTCIVCQRDLQLIQVRVLMAPGDYLLCEFFLQM